MQQTGEKQTAAENVNLRSSDLAIEEGHSSDAETVIRIPNNSFSKTPVG